MQYAVRGVNSYNLASAYGAKVPSVEPLINAATLLVPAANVGRLARDPRVAWVSPDRPVQAQSDELWGDQVIWGDRHRKTLAMGE